jgi:hypothetical protein
MRMRMQTFEHLRVLPRFFQMHRGNKHFETGKATVLPFTRFCEDFGMP